VALIFSLVGLAAGYGIAWGEPGLSIMDVLTHPWAYKSAIAALVGSLAWAPLLSWPRLWGIQPIDMEAVDRERYWARILGLVLALLGIFTCCQSWVQINDNGLARTELSNNAEILESWSIHRQNSGQETRYLVMQVEPIAPLPVVTGSITPAIPALQPAARAMSGTFGSAVHMHAQTSSKSRIDVLREVLINQGREAMESRLTSGVGGTKVSINHVGWLPIGELGSLPEDPENSFNSLEEGEVSEVFFADNSHQLIQRMDTRDRYEESVLLLRGAFDPSGFISLIAFVLGAILLWARRLGTAALVLSIGVGSVAFALYQGPSPVTISVQNTPDGPFTPFVLSGVHSWYPGLCAILGLTAAFAASYGYGASGRPRWLMRLSKGLASGMAGLATGLTSLYLFFQIWPPANELDPWMYFQLILVSYWQILMPASLAGGMICAFWNSRLREDKLEPV
jgi:hypothetical protein